jgi:nicotinamide mononucleotide transporter
MEALMNFFGTELFQAFGHPVSVIEVIGFITGGICVWLVAKQNIWNWPIGILNNAAFLILFIGAGLYADATLQVIFAVIAVYGWYKWTHAKGAIRADLPVTYSSWKERGILAGLTALATVAGVTGLVKFTNSEVAIWDTLILTMSLAATYYQAKKRIDSWWIWIAVDVISIPLYFSRGLALTAILYFIFLCICIKGLIDWKKSYNADKNAEPTDTIETAPVTV